MKNKKNYTLATCYGLGYARINRYIQSGTITSFFAMNIIFLISYIFNYSLYLTAIICSVISCVLAFYACYSYNKKYNDGDCKEITIDEFAGQAISMIPCNDYAMAFVGFLLFRFFDIRKPFIVGYFDKCKGSFYIVMDDISAGILSIIFNIFIFYWITLI